MIQNEYEVSPEELEKCLNCEKVECTNCLGLHNHRQRKKEQKSTYTVIQRDTGKVLAEGKRIAVARIMNVSPSTIGMWYTRGNAKYIVLKRERG